MLNRSETPLERCNLKFNEVGGLDATSNGLFEGYASTFGNIDAFGDTIMKGAFAETIVDRDHPVLMLFGHSTRSVVGKWLEMEEDDTGLYVRGEFTPGHTIANDVYASMRHGAISGLSIGFRIPADGAEDIEGGGRRISKVRLEEISIVGFPADADARVSVVKSEIESIESIRDAEIFLRDAGFSRSMAKALIGQFRPLYQREADEEHERKEAQRAALEWLHNLTSNMEIRS
jgi:HK97 family phage prohead protease